MARQNKKKRSQHWRGEAPRACGRNANFGGHNTASPLPHQQENSSPRSRQDRPFGGSHPHHTFNSRTNPRRRRPIPTSHSFHFRPQAHNHRNNTDHQENAAPSSPSTCFVPSTRCARCNSPHLYHIHRKLRNQTQSLLSGLQSLVAALDDLQPHPAEMEWVADTGTVVLMPRFCDFYGEEAGGKDTAGAEAGGGTGHGNGDGSGAAPREEHTMQQEEQRRNGHEMNPPPSGTSFSATSAREGRPATVPPAPQPPGMGPPGPPDQSTRPPYCPSSCFFEQMWDRKPEGEAP